MELTKRQLEIVLQWYSLADSYFEELGRYLSDEDYELKEKIVYQLKEEHGK